MGKLYKLTLKNEISLLIEDIVICNGPAFNSEGSIMYFSDSVNGRILEYDYGQNGIFEQMMAILQKR